jgi:hypothetical protein
VLFLLLNFVLSFLLIGCGSNLFKSLNLVQTPEQSLQDKLDNAKTGDTSTYTSVKAEAQKVIDDPNASTTNKTEAYFLKGSAILGENNSTIIDIASSFTNTQDTANIMSKLVANATGNVTAAADSLNQAANIGTLNNDQEITRGLANTVAAIDVISNFYEIKEDGSLGDPTSANRTVTENIAGLVSGGVLTYATQASDAFTNANALTTDQKKDTDEVDQKAEKISSLNAAVNTTNPSIVYSYTSGSSTVTVNCNSSEADINAALNSIFK